MRSEPDNQNSVIFHCYFKMDAPRALVFRPLVKGNEALGTRLSENSKISFWRRRSYAKQAILRHYALANQRFLRSVHILIKDGLLSSTQNIFDYILHSSKISELAKCYPLPKVMQYDDLYRRMQFATNCTWGTDSQFISHQTLHRPDSLTATTTRPVPPRKLSRPVINAATGKQVCCDFQRRDGCRFGSSCRYDHVCIKPQCLGTHPQWQHQSFAIQVPQL